MFGEMLSNVNWWFVVVMTVVSMLLGMIWYGPLFGKLYGKYLGMTAEKMNDPEYMKEQEKGMLPLMIGELVSRFVFFTGITWILSLPLNIEGAVIYDVLSYGLYVFIAFVFTTQVSAVLRGTADKRLVFITGGKMLVDIILAVLVATYWLN